MPIDGKRVHPPQPAAGITQADIDASLLVHTSNTDNPHENIHGDVHNIPATGHGGNTVRLRLAPPKDGDHTLGNIRVWMGTVNTQGTYLLTATKGVAGTNVLGAANFNMNGLAGADTVTEVALTATAADKRFNDTDLLELLFASNDAAFDGADIWVEVSWQKVADD
jgi:hypothetical protein